jgi:hypothetical protein
MLVFRFARAALAAVAVVGDDVRTKGDGVFV